MDFDPGPLTDYAADGVDLTLIRWMLSLTPGERLDYYEAHVNDVLAIWEYRGIQPLARAAGAE